MKTDFKRMELIEDYLQGKLKGIRKRKFEDALESDLKLQKEVENFSLSREIIKIGGRDNLRKTLEGIHNNLPKAEKNLIKLSLSKKINLLIDKLFEKYFIPYDNILTVRSSKKSDTQALAMQAYSEGNYTLAVKHFKSILKDSQKNDAVLFYCGVSLLELEKYKEAKSKFRKLIKLENSVFKQKAEWYLGLTYLKTYEVNKAIELFESMDKDSADYRASKKIIKSLKEL